MKGERRKHFRVPIPLDQSATFLRAGRRQFTVHVINASPQGFAVTCPKSLDAGRGDILRLRLSEGWVEVRVANMDALEGDTYPEEYDCALGLIRLRSLGYGPDDDWVVSTRTQRPLLLLTATVLIGLLVGFVFSRQSPPALRQVIAAFKSIALSR